MAESATVAKLPSWTATEAALKAAGLGLRATGEVGLADRLGHAIVRGQRYELQSLAYMPDVIGHIAAGKKLTPNIASLELDDARTSALLERSLGLAAQIK